MDGSSIEFMRYNPALKKEWDEFVESSKNGTFLLNRDYLEYHMDRFPDYSLMIFRKGKLYGLLPASKIKDEVSSHGGLTYGGIVMNEKCTTEGILEIMSALISHMRSEGIKKFIYKQIPYIYHSLPSDEDLYALFRCGANLKIRNVSSVIDFKKPLPYLTLRKRMIRKSKALGVTVRETIDYKTFWKILEENLKEKYDNRPVHNLDEIIYLSSLFPQIKLYASFLENKMTGGVLCYHTRNVVKVQYISANKEGKQTGSIDAIFSYLLSEIPTQARYFDFGTSNEDGGLYLNQGLIHQKEGFGGRAVCYDTYEIIL